MLPKTHIILGAIFSLIFYPLFPNTEVYNIVLIFLSSFLIDFDHYLAAAIKDRRNLNIFRSFKYHLEIGKDQARKRSKGVREKESLNLFHTIEFHLVVLLIGIFFFSPFIYIFIGMLFHSLSDFFYLIKVGYLYRREFLLINYIKNKVKKKNKIKKLI